MSFPTAKFVSQPVENAAVYIVFNHLRNRWKKAISRQDKQMLSMAKCVNLLQC